VVVAIPITYYLYIKDNSILSGLKKSNEPLYNFLLNKWYFDELYNFLFIKPLKFIGFVLWKKGDQNIIDRYGPDGFSKVIKFLSNKTVKFQSGFIYDYAFVMLLGLSFLLTYLIIN
jgi:NADH-quinone oxidoreductase subunit L